MKRQVFIVAALSLFLTRFADAQTIEAPYLQTPSTNLPTVNPFQVPQTPQSSAPALQTEGGKNESNFVLGTSASLSAVMSDGGAVLTKGVVWRVFSERADEVQGLTLVTETKEATPTLRLPPGTYVINAAYGRASVTRRLMLGNVPIRDKFILNAGGLTFAGIIGEKNIPDTRVTASIFTGPGPGGVLVMQEAQAGKIVRLPAGDYHIISKYGDANSILAADVSVKAGKVTEVTLNHRSAAVTFKLVKDKGGEAIANTTWSILTPGGDTVAETIGAFPSIVLTQGEYTAIARNDGRVFTTTFKVDAGRDIEMEVLMQ